MSAEHDDFMQWHREQMTKAHNHSWLMYFIGIGTGLLFFVGYFVATRIFS